jgi:DNA helicase-2/ATP-dependent DNA helicase PcrA
LKSDVKQSVLSFTDEELYGNSSPEQRVAIDHFGNHARLLAGPGTGKTETMTRRVLALVTRHGVDPKSVLVLTFTRLAARQLREKIGAALDPVQCATPSVATLHSFALREILHNANVASVLPYPIRIADDWEQRNVIEEDIKRILTLGDVREAQELFNLLSADWETLSIEDPSSTATYPNPQFIGAWKEHQKVFGETLRAELVYQLSRELNQNAAFQLDSAYGYVLVDEFQDLNACDLAVIQYLAQRGAEIFAAGDDDQSIYGFRYASPEGIRRFAADYAPATDLQLSVCYRCDQEILRCCTMVANEDPRRLMKSTRAQDGAAKGKVILWQCRDQFEEAERIAAECKKLVGAGIKPEGIAVLLRSDHYGWLSKPIIDALRASDLPVAKTASVSPDIANGTEQVLALLRLALTEDDSLAMRDLLLLENWQVGPKTLGVLYDVACRQHATFAEIVRMVAHAPEILPRGGKPLARFIDDLSRRTGAIRSAGSLVAQTNLAVSLCSLKPAVLEPVDQHFKLVNAMLDSEASMEDLLRLESGVDSIMEQDDTSRGIRVLSMHQAKGLSFDACFVAAAEDEFIPGKSADTTSEDDERRLLYVSMSRARHELVISYCNRRTGSQERLGAQTGRSVHALTRFLRDLKLPQA